MSRRRRSRTSRQSSPPSSPIVSPVAPIEQPDTAAEPSPIIIRYAETGDDVNAIHQFLLVVAQPSMRCPVNPEKSLLEIIRIARESVALMAIRDGRLIGTLGILRATWWYGDEDFLTDRWNHALPQERHGDAGPMLEAEAEKIAAAAGLDWINQGKLRQKKDVNKFLYFPRLSPKSATTSESRSA